MDELILIVGKVMAILLAVGAGFWYAQIGTNWGIKLVGPLVLSFAAFMVGSFTFGDPKAGDSFQPQVWLVMGGGVLAGVAADKLGLSRFLGIKKDSNLPKEPGSTEESTTNPDSK